jgi:arsenate reductase
LLRERGVEFDVVEYLKQPLTKAQLETIVDAIDVEPAALVRQDPRFKELGLDPADYTTKTAVVRLLVEHPALMQRPIAVRGARTILARPKEKILDLL